MHRSAAIRLCFASGGPKDTSRPSATCFSRCVTDATLRALHAERPQRDTRIRRVLSFSALSRSARPCVPWVPRVLRFRQHRHSVFTLQEAACLRPVRVCRIRAGEQRQPRGVVTALNARTRLRSAEHMFFQRRSSERRSSTTTSCRSAAVALLFDHLIGVVRVFPCLGVSISCLETEAEPAAAPRATTHSGWRGSNRRALWLRLRARARFRGQRRGAAAAAQLRRVTARKY